MPEINPLSNDQIFLKKIAENTGSDYDTGDVSEINPLTIDQILLKEIAANTAGQSGDITELEEKVTANAEAIEAMVNVNGACNLANPNNIVIQDADGIFTINSDGSITVNGTPSAASYIMYKTTPNPYDVIIKGASTDEKVYLTAHPYSGSWEGISEGDIVHGVSAEAFAINVDAGVTVNNVTVYPMLYDARLTPTGYVPYAMTNRALTESVEETLPKRIYITKGDANDYMENCICNVNYLGSGTLTNFPYSWGIMLVTTTTPQNPTRTIQTFYAATGNVYTRFNDGGVWTNWEKQVIEKGSVSVTADGVKTYRQLLQDLYAITDVTKVSMDAKLVFYTGMLEIFSLTEFSVNSSFFKFIRPASVNAYGEIVSTMQIGVNNDALRVIAYGGAEHDESDIVATTGYSFTLYY